MGKVPIPERHEGLRVVTAAEMAEIDRRAIEEFAVPALELMENAGKAVAAETAAFLAGRGAAAGRVTVCCGRGNNGGDGLVAARHLKALGIRAEAFLAPPHKDRGYGPEVRANLEAARAAGVPVQPVDDDLAALDESLRACDAALDALLGTGSSGKPAGAVHKMIQALARSGKPVIAVDIPSGIHPDTGYHSGAFVTAALTLTLGAPKRGLLAAHAARNVGTLKVLDIGFPRGLLL